MSRVAPAALALAPAPTDVAALAGTAPRYTSYPPATAFAPISPEVVAEELARLGATRDPVGLYVHVPFCRSLCWYCGCNVVPTREAARGEAYARDLARAVRQLADLIGARLPITDLALGGGSPNFLTSAALIDLAEAVTAAFEPTADTRRSIELDPRTTSSAQVRALAALGFRVASLGVQDFSAAVQRAIHRHQSVAQTRGLADDLRAAGFTDLNLDLVYGLPFQTLASLEATLDEVLAIAPERIALFGYAHLPERLPHQRLVEQAGPLPDATARAALFLAARTRLAGAGYRSIGLDHFARPGSALALAADEGRLARSFQGYVERRAVATLGVGASAISTTPRLIWQAPVAVSAWQDAIAAGSLPVAVGVARDLDDQLRGDVIEALMCEGQADLAAIGAAHGVDGVAYFAGPLAALRTSPLVVLDGASLTVTPLGQVLVREVARTFDRHTGDATRGSASV